MPRYDAFLLRIWQGEGRWAARLEQLPDGTVLRFHRRSALLAYLRALAGPDTVSADPCAVQDPDRHAGGHQPDAAG